MSIYEAEIDQRPFVRGLLYEYFSALALRGKALLTKIFQIVIHISSNLLSVHDT